MNDELPHPLIKHVVVLMLENRGFDHIMGWLYTDQEAPAIVGRQDDDRPFMGLSTLSEQELAGLANPMPGNRGTLPVNKGSRSPKTPSFNTGETFEHIFNQMWGQAQPQEFWWDPVQRDEFINAQQAPAPMNGYVLDYDLDTFHTAKRHLSRDELSEVMDTYTPEQMPVLSGLARNYAVSDEWYCSVPSQTNTNRAFSVTGTSRGLVNNSFYDPQGVSLTIPKLVFSGKSHTDALPVSTRSLFEVLEQANYSWKVFWQSTWPPSYLTQGQKWLYTQTMIPLLGSPQFKDNFVQFDAANPQNAFFEAARRGELPAVSWIEPKWGGGPQWNSTFRIVGNDCHPVSDTTTCEDFVMNLYMALSQSPKWNETLLVITFDENGGTYDHVIPPAAAATANDACPLPRPTGADPHMDPQTRTQFGFDFRQFGVRVPTLLISPCAPANTIFRSTTDTPFDHTSVISTILSMAQIDPAQWMLGDRVAAAPTFENVLVPPVARDPASTLSVPFGRSTAEALCFNTDYILEYVGDIWRQQPGSQYLASFTSGKFGYYKYPTLTTDPPQAVRFRFVPEGGGQGTGLVLNMAALMIRTSEQALASTPYFTVSWENSVVYYDQNKGGPSRWQLRILGSRNPRDEVRAGDLVYFVAQLPPPKYRPHEQTQPDPYQRLIPHPDQPAYVTTRPGEWALWKVHAALGADNV